MHIYFSGIGGVGLGPLAEVALGAEHIVSGSDTHSSAMTDQLTKAGVPVSFDQSGANLVAVHAARPIDWLVYTSGLPADHPELLAAKKLKIHISKRDELLNQIIDESGQKLLAVAGTHGKTTTTAMLAWTLKQLGYIVSYSIGTAVSFGPSGYFHPSAHFFVYECDEFDRNFLQFHPHLSLITSLDFDHPDTYTDQKDYSDAFTKFIDQSDHTIIWQRDALLTGVQTPLSAWRLNDAEVMDLTLPGAHNRANGTLVAKACEYLGVGNPAKAKVALNLFPGSARRFEKLADNLYTDYGHHPVEIAATLELARELSNHVVLVYQPHQNTRQHHVSYTSCMELAEQIYWLPTYQTREDPALSILKPTELTEKLVNRQVVRYADLDDELWRNIQDARSAGKLVLLMGAGTIDGWVRTQLVDNI